VAGKEDKKLSNTLVIPVKQQDKLQQTYQNLSKLTQQIANISNPAPASTRNMPLTC
jgi:hypothetical protein